MAHKLNILLSILLVLIAVGRWGGLPKGLVSQAAPVPAASQAPAASLHRLQLAAQCSHNPALYREWRVLNPNPVAVVFVWHAAGGAWPQWGIGIVGPANGTREGAARFRTVAVPGRNKVCLWAGGVLQGCAQSDALACPAPATPTPQTTAPAPATPTLQTTAPATLMPSATPTPTGPAPVQPTATPVGCPAWDVNCDGRIDVQDVVAVGNRWCETGVPRWRREDVNGDGTINIIDIVLIGNHWSHR